jgi:activator of HSP90 ATPase
MAFGPPLLACSQIKAIPTETHRQMMSQEKMMLIISFVAAPLSGRAAVRTVKVLAAGRDGEKTMSNSIRQEVNIKASPTRVYDTLLDAKRFSAFTGAPAEIDPKSGGAFSCFGGIITGRNIELLPDQRIVQAWRVAVWPEGLYSIVKFELQPQGPETRLVLDHVGFPEEMRAHLNGEEADGGWHRRYWEPLKKYLA